jgi:hypothetical protein
MSVNTDICVPKIAELIAEQIQDDIAAGRLRAGDSLPSEAAIMTRFGASRPPSGTRCGFWNRTASSAFAAGPGEASG